MKSRQAIFVGGPWDATVRETDGSPMIMIPGQSVVSKTGGTPNMYYELTDDEINGWLVYRLVVE